MLRMDAASFKGRWFHICSWFVLTRRFMAGYFSVCNHFCFENVKIFTKSIDCDLGTSLIALSVNFHGYKQLQNLILILFTKHDLRNQFSWFVWWCAFLIGIRNIINSMSNSQTLLLMHWRLNSDKINKNSIIEKYRIIKKSGVSLFLKAQTK